MDEKLFSKIAEKIKRHPEDYQAYRDLYDLAVYVKQTDIEVYLKYLRLLAAACEKAIFEPEYPQIVSQVFNLHKEVLLALAPYDFDSYIQYIEWDREPRKKFYMPRRKQLRPVVEALQDLEDDKLDLLAISLPPGTGKALANDTPILTRKGWKKHGDLVVGDEVIGMDGKFKKVIAVHPKCQLDVLVEFTNGEKIVCHENHEWMYYDRTTHKTITQETHCFEKRVLETGIPGKRGHRYLLQLPRRGYVAGENKELPLDPYTFGVWLGDGANQSPRISSPKSDHPIIDRIVANGYSVRWSTCHKTTGVMYYDFGFRKELREMGMCHSKKRTQKHIPEAYLTASIEQRLQLLAGLLDTDGCLTGSKYKYSTVDPVLRDNFLDLLSTFGWRASVKTEAPKLSSSGIQGRHEVYVIGFTPDTEIPCALLRKRNTEPHKQRKIAFKKISRVSPQEGNCITVEGDGMYLAGKTMLPTHNTTLAMFFLTWLAGKHPDDQLLTGSHSNSFVRGVYDECLRVFQTSGEYLWHDVFPKLAVTSTNAKDCRIDLGARQRFETLEFTSIGTGNAGLYRASRLLYCDDLVSGIEVALSKERLEKLWETYTTDLRQRKIGDHCKELHIATRWSVHDVIGRLEVEYADNPRAKFITVPALNADDESNFKYAYGVGFSTEFYHEQRAIMDDASWRALYMNEPIEREGLVYHEDELRRYWELPSSPPDAILSICDTKDAGKDYCFMPVCYVYGEDHYMADCICDNGLPEVVDIRLAEILLRHKVKACRFESNSAGRRTAEKVQDMVKSRGGITHITSKFTKANKETKILINSDWVKEHVLFKDQSMYTRNSDYGKAMNMLCSYTMMGKNKHDDVPDGIAQYAEFVQSLEGTKVEVFTRPW